MRTAMNKKLKALSQQLEEMHEEKQAAVKVSFVGWYGVVRLQYIGTGSLNLPSRYGYRIVRAQFELASVSQTSGCDMK